MNPLRKRLNTVSQYLHCRTVRKVWVHQQEEDVVKKWYGCFYATKRGLKLFIGKAMQRFLNSESGLLTPLEIDCLEPKLGTTDCILKWVKKSNVNIFPVQSINCGFLNANPLSNGCWECPMYAEILKIFEINKKVIEDNSILILFVQFFDN